jgi:2-dehydro-3-deoxyphosphogluconate aldolase / (4S)-4-hydroxy-2-oxoglutarate aldolase
MAKFNRQEILQCIDKDGFVPLFTHTDEDICKNVLKASYGAGIRMFEFTNRHSNSFDLFIAMRKFRDQYLPEMMLGIGTIKNAQQAEQFIHAGADFLISPLIREDIHIITKKHDKLWMPGCATASEIGMAEYWGINVVKIFPARQLGGPAYIKAMKAVFPAMQFVATGGVEPKEEDIKSWFNAGATAVGIGSQLFPNDWLVNQQYELVTDHIKKIIQYVEKYKSR